MKNLVIVESPAKAKTITKYLGKGYTVIASMGHIRDLPASKLGIDTENNYEPQYINIKGKAKLIKEIKKAAKGCDFVYLATDPDREGEAISWHLAFLLGLDINQENRVTFGEITKKGVTTGMQNPRTIDKDLFDAQQARRVLDRLVGYKLSPFLWKKVKPGLSAGRVHSVAVKLIVDKEREIEAFVPAEYWNIDAVLNYKTDKKSFTARLYSDLEGNKLEVKNEETATKIVDSLNDKDYIIKKVTKGKRKKQPAPPFITSTLQQEASRRFGFTPVRTMRAAQVLYEGMDIKGLGTTGLITYMRTDSLRLSDEAVTGAKEFINSVYGEKYAYDGKRVFKGKNQSNAQDAHEAIRPSIPSLTPDEVEKSISGDQAKIYRLIWSRFMASQMADCLQDTVTCDVQAADYIFRAKGFTTTFEGFTALYEETTEEKEKKETSLPALVENEKLKLKELKSEQKFTQPPPRYTEASLIKALEENGIGRPSTYAPTIMTVIDRGYIERENKKLVPTALGYVTNDLMQEQFPNIVDLKFSAKMEQDLDTVEHGETDWHNVISGFYQEFAESLTLAEENMKDKKLTVPVEETDEICELCGKNMVIKLGRYGKFLACPGFPECKNTRYLTKAANGKCPKCGGKILVKKSKRGRVYYGCEKNPTCDFMSWDEPTDKVCEKCNKTMFKKAGKTAQPYCLTQGCENNPN